MAKQRRNKKAAVARKSGKTNKIDKLLSKAITAYHSNQLDTAIRLLSKILEIDEGNHAALHTLGVIMNNSGKCETAISLLGRAITLAPNNVNYHTDLGNALSECNMLNKAVAAYGEAIRLNPRHAMAYNNLGNAFFKLNRMTDAINCYNVAIELDPNLNLAQTNKAAVLWKLGYSSEAEIINESVFSSEEVNTPEIYINYGASLVANNELTKANDVYNEGLKSFPEDPGIRWGLSLLQLLTGNYAEGWSNYEYGFHTKNSVRKKLDLNIPEWSGEDLSDSNILLYGEQGIGDEIMFAQYFSGIINSAKKCFIACEPRLAPIFARSFPKADIISGHTQADIDTLLSNIEMDFQCTFGAIPEYLNSFHGNTLCKDNYLYADTTKTDKWEARYAKLDGKLNIGISWKGGKDIQTQAARSTSLEQWIDILKIENVNFVNLQYGDVTQELQDIRKQHGITIHHWDDSDPLSDMDDFAAQIATLDLVISIDNSTVHTSGALGISTWTLLPWSPEWRWGVEGYNTHWYSALTLFRQSDQGNWYSVFNEITARLEYALNSSQPYSYISPPSMPTAVLVNDTSSWYHWGCTCTSTAIKQQLSIHGLNISSIPTTDIYACNTLLSSSGDFDDDDIYTSFSNNNTTIINSLSNADIVIINGEGTLHGTSKAALYLLYIAYIAKSRLNKRVHIINHSCYPEDKNQITDAEKNEIYRKVYKTLDYIAVREPISTNLLYNLEIDATDCFDCLPLYVKNNFSEKIKKASNTILISGAVNMDASTFSSFSQYMKLMTENGFNIKVLVGAKSNPAQDDFIFIDQLKQVTELNFEVINASSSKEWLQTIAEAKLLVSGRFHHSIAAAFLGTPFIAFDSNTPKIEGASNVLGVKGPISSEEQNSNILKVLLERTVDALENPSASIPDDETKDEIIRMALSNFDNLDSWISKFNNAAH